VCGVRRNTGGTLEALTYGLVSSVAADPIEKKPVFHYRPGTRVLSLGSVGCSMRCGHCQNWQISRAAPDDDSRYAARLTPDDVVAAAREHNCPGVAFTYNEPVIWAEFVRDCAQTCHAAGLFTIMVTNGYITAEGLDFLGEHIDVWRVDVKGASEQAYRTLCKVPSPGPVFEAAARAKHHWGMHVEVVTNVVPTVNDSPEELRAIAAWISADLGPDTPWHITRFFPYLDFAHLDPTPISALREARRIGQAEGLHFVFLGNVADAGTEDTLCPSCGALAIVRTGYTVVERSTLAGACAACGRDLGIVE
jgi:pyruvate formate lyase activating enzyme